MPISIQEQELSKGITAHFRHKSLSEESANPNEIVKKGSETFLEDGQNISDGAFLH